MNLISLLFATFVFTVGISLGTLADAVPAGPRVSCFQPASPPQQGIDGQPVVLVFDTCEGTFSWVPLPAPKRGV